MEVKEIIEKKRELEYQIQGLVNDFYKETDVPIEEVKVEYIGYYPPPREEYARKYIIKAKLKNPFD